MRRGELCALKWSDVDLSARILRVQRAVVAIPGGTLEKSTKTKSKRRISLDPTTIDTLRHHQSNKTQIATGLGIPLSPDPFVFSHAPDQSTPLHPDNTTAAFRRLKNNNGISRLHDLRRAHATQLLMAGVPPKTVSGRLGHAMG